MSYPLNIYALILERQAGSADYLHYGLFEGPDDAVGRAQARAVELLLTRIPSQGRILDVGCGFGGLTELLRRRGNQVVGMTPDASQIALAQSRYGFDLPVKCTKLEDFSEDAGQWDVLAFHESSQYVPMLKLFERASALLREDGSIVILDEFACRRVGAGQENLHLKDHFIELAKRFGFVCDEAVDLTARAQPSLDFLIRAIERQSDDLAAMTGVEKERLTALLESNREYLAKYQQGRFGYFLLHFKRQSIPRWRLSELSQEDQPAVSALFKEVFGHELSPAMWNWKYGHGRGESIGLWDGDRLIAHYGGTVRQFVKDGTVLTACQNGDVMVAANVRGSLVRHGPLFQVAATYLEQFIGYGRRYLFAYGFPNERAYRLPHKLGLYSLPTAHVNEASWPAAAAAFGWLTVEDLDPSAQDGQKAIDELWKRMSRELGHLYVGVRDAEYIRNRYAGHPTHSYRILLVRHRWLRSNLAVIVVRSDGARLELLDWVAGVAQMPKIVAAARLVAGRCGLSEVFLWASDPILEMLKRTSPAMRDLQVLVPNNAWTIGLSAEALAGKLWLTGGDTDFH